MYVTAQEQGRTGRQLGCNAATSCTATDLDMMGTFRDHVDSNATADFLLQSKNLVLNFKFAHECPQAPHFVLVLHDTECLEADPSAMR